MNLSELLEDCHETQCLSGHQIDLIERNLRIKTALANYQRAVSEPPLTKREWFAGMALPVIIASATVEDGNSLGGDGLRKKCVSAAIMFADTLILELSKPPTP